MVEFLESPEFKRDYKKIRKKYGTLDDDFEEFKTVLVTYPEGTGAKHWILLTEQVGLKIYKARMHGVFKGKFLRVVYAYRENESIFEFIEFIEIFEHASGKMREDEVRIKKYIKNNLCT